MFKAATQRFFGTHHERELKKLNPLVQKINALEPELQALSNDDLKNKTVLFKERLAKGESLDSLLPETFAVCRETSVRVLGLRHYDVQLIGGMVLHSGKIAEMKTGEGKTLVATLPIYLNALTGKGTHVVTVNDYLAKRDQEWMGQIYNWLGLSTATIVNDLNDEERKKAYEADITYCTNNELGFDYLRDNMKFEIEQYVQKPLYYAIVDECDSILVDEARTPLIISGPAEESTSKYYEINKVVPRLQPEKHFTTEEKTKTASLTEEGNNEVEKLLGIENLYDPQHISLLHHIYQALKAHHLFKKDVDYMVKEGEIMIVDEFTGRLMSGRRWSDGLHQAIEAKEGVKVKNENQTLASITFQNYFRMYEKLAGMTGTAETEAVEFKKIYDLDVMVIPTHKPIIRKDQDDIVYKTESAKYNAIAKDIQERKKKGQPVLVGTISIEKSENISQRLNKLGVSHHVLNAKHHEKEAEIVAQAGRKSAITIATNMAGRGTDIVLGGNPEALAHEKAQGQSEKFESILENMKKQCEAEKQEVLNAGGLYVVGTERHDSRRIDNQLRGRSGRQGDPGESCFYLSLEDNLMRIFNGERIQKIMTTLKVPDDEPIVAGMVSKAIEGAQRKVEGYNFDIRKHLLEYDDVMNQQRNIIYSMRKKILQGEDIERDYLDILGDVLSEILDNFAHEDEKREKWNLDGLNTALQKQFGLSLDFENPSIAGEKIIQSIQETVKGIYDQQNKNLGEHTKNLQKLILLQVIDTHWKDHLQSIDRIKEGINLRAFAQKDPLIEYKKEAFHLFEKLESTIKKSALETFLKVQIQGSPQAEEGFQQKEHSSQFTYSGGEDELPLFPQASPQAPSQKPQELHYNSGEEGSEENQLNRAERRKAHKKDRKKLRLR